MDESLISRINSVDILSDFDGTIISGNSGYRMLLEYFQSLPLGNRINLLQKICSNPKKCLERNVPFFYSLLEDCPVKVLDPLIEWCKTKENNEWTQYVEREGFERIGVDSRNTSYFIKKYLKLREDAEKIEVVEANVPEILDGVYTGNVEVKMTNEMLGEVVKIKDYLGDHEAMMALKNSRCDVVFKKIGRGLWRCSKKNVFVVNPLNFQNLSKT